jgi:hypothetical protein
MTEPDVRGPNAGGEESRMSVLALIVQRLNSQPLLFALGVLLLLVVAAGLTTNALAVLVWPALAIFVVGSVAWLAVELRNAGRATPTAPNAGVELRARGVGKGGSVTGIKGMPPSMAPPERIKLDAKDVEGQTTAVDYDRKRE